MDKLQKCAKAFENLLEIQYRIIIGRKGKTVELVIGFSKLDFHHLMGLGKLKDLRIAKQNRGSVFDEIITGITTYETLTKSRYLAQIENRFEPLALIEQLLDDNRLVFRYNTKLNQFSLIEADYLLSTPFENSDIYISQVYDGEMKRIVLKDQYGPISVYLLPFLKPAAVRHALQRDDINTYEEGVMAALQECEIDTTQRNVLVAHQFVTGADRSDSEETWVGGLDNVSAEVFKDFDYVALGHIHRPQKMGRETLRYSGTPLKYSFSEADHKKSVTIVELLEKGNVRVSTVPLIPRRDMRKLRGTYMDVTAKDHYTAENKMDYLQITLTDEEDVPGALQKLRTVYPNLMRLEYDNKRTRENREVQAVEAQEQKSELELFEEFYELLNNEPMKEEQTEFVEKLIQDLKEVRV